ncbi:TylF/MycF family methyltransferase [Sinimarinibacterium thermocellulolyticum]|uniref:TylF/MycF family methyltransferase n=1 Tax=Sinimarinibacterium thermocellulolyticum TaxID=3170016 RepID=A0ABV2AB19_9GAMM
MDSDVRGLYLDLLKKTLSFSLWEDIGHPIEMNNHLRRLPFRLAVAALSRGLRVAGLQAYRIVDRSRREEGRVWPRYADTMIGMKRLDNLQYCLERVIADAVPGDVIETGVWRGGATIFMKGCLRAYGDTTRRVFVADSFQGLPPPDPDKYPEDAGDRHHTLEHLAVSEAQVRANFERYGLLDERVVFLKGWFKDTLPTAPIERLAVMRLDGDMYESTMDALRPLYPKLSEGGFCIIDDYALPGCRKAVDEFRAANGITSPIHKIDWSGVYWRK